MRYLKMLGLLAVAMATLMAFAGTASATILTSPEGTTYTSGIKVESTTSELHGAFIAVECLDSKATGTVESHGAGKYVGGKLSSLTFKECNYTTTVKSAGSLSIDSGSNVISSGAEISVATSVGTCVFTTSNTYIGILTGGIGAKIDVGSKIPRTGGSFLCGSSGTWTGYYHVMTPSVLYVD